MRTHHILLALKGVAMGIAEVIPGVSGGTIAFITGIYERLLEAIRSFDLRVPRLLLTWRIADLWKHVDGAFLLVLLGGMAIGVVAGIFGVSWLLEHEKEMLYAFFFGLILASAWYVGRKVPRWQPSQIAALAIGIGVAFLITQVSPAEGNLHPAYIMISGFLAVSALMLPGISGSFILLLLGMYALVLGAVKQFLSGSLEMWWIILSFVAGMIAGLLIFSRVLTWMFRRYHDMTLALLAGFMLGSLGKIWPWRIPAAWLDANGNLITEGTPGEHARILEDQVVMPSAYTAIGEPHTVGVVICFVLGIALIAIAIIAEKHVRKTGEVVS
jgi:putative membrane protein